MKKLLPLWMFLPIFLVLAACSDNSEDIDRYYATVSTPKVTTTTPTSLTVTASVTGDLNQIVKKGFCYSAAASVPTIKDHVVDADENFSASLSTLTSGTSYYIRAYVYCDSRYVHSEVVTATTESLSLDDELKNYVAPTYSDDYTSISDWSKRSQWNLANVHDPRLYWPKMVIITCIRRMLHTATSTPQAATSTVVAPRTLSTGNTSAVQ